MKVRNSLVWFVITAAFIGPGTVTTATAAGAAFGYSLLWTLVSAVVACIVLQEGVARIHIVAGLTLGQAVRHTLGGRWPLVIAAAIVLGCAAYEAGNILGAVSGVQLITGSHPALSTLIIVALAALLLASGRFKLLTHLLAFIIGLMGLGLLVLVVSLHPDVPQLARGLLVPKIPAGGELLTLGLIGTTVVPYNLFLGSQLAAGQQLRTMRAGLALATTVGGLISMALIVIGTQVQGKFNFTNVATALNRLTDSWGGWLFAFGLFAAGLTSAITAPWAAAISYTSTLKADKKGKSFVYVWAGVLATGLVFGVSGIKPVPVIILAQAANGIVLPLLATLLFIILNNRQLLPEHTNSRPANLLLLLVIWITTMLGLLNVYKACLTAIGSSLSPTAGSLMTIGALSLLYTIVMAIKQAAKKQRSAPH